MPQLLCRDTQGKEEEAERGLVGEQHGPCRSQRCIRDGTRLRRCPHRSPAPSASRAALEQYVSKGPGQGLAPRSRAGLRLLTGPQAVIHGRGNPPALLSVPTLTPVPIPTLVLPGSSTGATARWRSCNLLRVPRPRAAWPSCAALSGARTWTAPTLGTQLRNQVYFLERASQRRPATPHAQHHPFPGDLQAGRVLHQPKNWGVWASQAAGAELPSVSLPSMEESQNCAGYWKSSQQPVLLGRCIPQPSRSVSSQSQNGAFARGASTHISTGMVSPTQPEPGQGWPGSRRSPGTAGGAHTGASTEQAHSPCMQGTSGFF